MTTTCATRGPAGEIMLNVPDPSGAAVTKPIPINPLDALAVADDLIRMARQDLEKAI